LNTFHLTDAERKALARKAKRKGTTAIWLVAPGSVTDGGFSDRAMSELTGMELSGADREPHVVCGGKVETLSARGYKAYVKALGEDARAVFIPITPEDWRGWRSLFDQLGVRADAPGGNYFRRHGDVLMFHVGSGGAYELRVPDMATGDVAVELFSGRNFASAPLKLTATAPETWLLRIFRKRK
jgi:hypothetical protein